MAELKPEQLATQVESGPLRPAYLIAGPEPLRVLEAADAVRAAARAQGINEREIFEAEGNQREPDWSAMEASFRAPSLFSSKRLFELRLPSGKPGTEGARVISEFCADPPIRHHPAGDGGRLEPPARRQVERSDRARRVRSRSPGRSSRTNCRTGSNAACAHAGSKADRDAVQLLADRVEGNLLAAAQEIEKLELLSDGGVLDSARMENLVADAARFDVFRLIDAAMNGQGAQVSRMLRGLRGEGEAVPALLGMVIKELQTAAALARAGNLANAFKAQRIWDSKQPMYRRALQRHEAKRWDAFLAQAGRVDGIAKGRPRLGQEPDDAWIALERLLLAVAEPRATRLLAVRA